LSDLWNGQYIIQIPTPITVSDTMITNVSVEGHECFASLSMASPSGRNYATMELSRVWTISLNVSFVWLGISLGPHEQPDRRRQIALLAIVIDRADQLRQRHAALRGNFLYADPEGFFEADEYREGDSRTSPPWWCFEWRSL
jgi:hypothetical protein